MKMIDILVIEKTGKVKEVSLKKCVAEDFYKKAGFKKADGFICLHTWNLDEFNGNEYHISLYGKKEGRAGQENKYELPPPLDSDLLFGNLVLVNQVDDKYVSFSSKEWKKIYEHLYGGFEDLEEDSEEEASDEDDGTPKTKSGYAKDGFVVDESDEAGDESFEDETEEDVKNLTEVHVWEQNQMVLGVLSRVFIMGIVGSIKNKVKKLNKDFMRLSMVTPTVPVLEMFQGVQRVKDLFQRIGL